MGQELMELRELYNNIRTRPEKEAFDIFTRIRNSNNPVEILRLIKEADLLLLNPTTGVNVNPRVEKLNLDALQISKLKVPYSPWTNVSGARDGIVSELISTFFAYENIFFDPSVYQEVFIEEMHGRDIDQAKYCTPLLVNAICAQSSVSSSSL